MEIVDAALDLFDSDGYEAVTMEQVAHAAGVSRRTLYRHFPTKDRLLLDLPLEWMEMWDDVVAALPPTTAPREVIERAARAIASHLEANRQRIRTAWRIIDTAPALEPAFLANPVWTQRVVALLTDPARGAVLAPREAVAIAGAYLGAIDAVMLHWAAAGAGGTVTEAVDTVITQLAPIWPGRDPRQD
jgi:AcrR family transcriptional regulator